MKNDDISVVSTQRMERRASGAVGVAGSSRPRTVAYTPTRTTSAPSPLRLVGRASGTSTGKHPRPARLRHNQMLADGATVTIGLAATYALSTTMHDTLHGARLAVVAACTVVAWVGALVSQKLYVARVIERPSEELRRLLAASLLGASSLVLVAFFARYELPSRGSIAAMFLLVTSLLAVERRIARRVFARLRSSGRITRRIAVIGADAHAAELADSVQRNPGLGYEIVGLIGDDATGRRLNRRVLGSVDRAADILREHDCVGALISLNSVNTLEVNRLTRTLTDQSFHVALSTGLRDIDVTRMRPQGLDGQTLIYVEPTIRNGWRAVAKRAFDLLIACIGLIVSAPFVAVAALFIKLESDGPVFFRQDRVGRDGATFRMIKLRSMYQDAEQRKAELLAQNESDGPLFKMRNDPRITRTGRIIRKLSIDELPQFWNVLRGDMSIVGPRPALPSEVAEWDVDLHERLRVLPGITGMWQVSGRSDSSFDDYKRLDLYYVDNWSLLHDIRIVLKTFSAVVLQRGAS